VPGNQGEQCQEATPRTGGRERLIAALDAETAEGPEAEHENTREEEFDRDLTGR
jgi:hypothetical protein